MPETPQTVRATLDKDHRVLEKLAVALDCSRLRPPEQMRELLSETLTQLEPALRAHEALLAERPWEDAELRSVASFQHDAIRALLKDLKVLLAEPAQYRSEHLASLTFRLARSLRDHLRFEESL